MYIKPHFKSTGLKFWSVCYMGMIVDECFNPSVLQTFHLQSGAMNYIYTHTENFIANVSSPPQMPSTVEPYCCPSLLKVR